MNDVEVVVSSVVYLTLSYVLAIVERPYPTGASSGAYSIRMSLAKTAAMDFNAPAA